MNSKIVVVSLIFLCYLLYFLTPRFFTSRYVTFIEQKGECIIRYFGRPCDEFAERVWPIKIYDGAWVTLFNKGLVSCDVNQSFLIFLFEWECVSFMMISCIFCYGRYCMMWRHLAPPPLWVSWDSVRLLAIEKRESMIQVMMYLWFHVLLNERMEGQSCLVDGSAPIMTAIHLFYAHPYVWLYLLKEKLNSEFHQYQQNKQSPLTSNNWTKIPRQITLEVNILEWDRHTNMLGWNTNPSNNWSPRTIYRYKQTLKNLDSLSST